MPVNSRRFPRSGRAALLALTLPSLAHAGGGTAPLPALHSPDPVRSVAAGTDGQGRFVVTWVSRHQELAEGGGEQLRAARLDGTRWTPLGLVNEKAQYNAAQPHVHASPDGSVWLDWEEGSGHAHIDSFLISRWTPQGWTAPAPYALRRNLSDAGRSRSLTLDAQGRPLVAWTDIGTGTRSMYPSVVSLKVWQPASQTWQTTPYLNLNLHQPAFMPSVAVRGTTPTVAYVEGATTQSDLWVREWTGQTWRTLGGPLNRHPHTYIFGPQLRSDRQGRLTVAWLEDLDGLDVLRVSRWTGHTWQPLGGPVSDPRLPAASLGLTFDMQDRPLVTWTQGPDGQRRVHAARWDASRWTSLGGPLNTDPRADTDHASIAAGPRGVLVAWRELQGGTWTLQTRHLP